MKAVARSWPPKCLAGDVQQRTGIREATNFGVRRMQGGSSSLLTLERLSSRNSAAALFINMEKQHRRARSGAVLSSPKCRGKIRASQPARRMTQEFGKRLDFAFPSSAERLVQWRRNGAIPWIRARN